MEGEQDFLQEEISSVKKERDQAKMDALEVETDIECKDEYIDHHEILLEPHLGLITAEITNEIGAILVDIMVIVTPTDHHATKSSKDVEASLLNIGVSKLGDTSVVVTQILRHICLFL